MKNYLNTGEEEALLAYKQKSLVTIKNMEQLELVTHQSNEIHLINAINNSVNSLFQLYDVMMQDTGYINYIDNYATANKIFEYITGYFNEYINLLMVTLTEEINVVEQQSNKTITYINTFVTVSAIAYLILTFTFAEWITKPIRMLVESAKKIGAGDYDFEDLPIENEDELGHLTVTFNAMKHDLKRDRQQVERQLSRLAQEQFLNSKHEPNCTLTTIGFDNIEGFSNFEICHLVEGLGDNNKEDNNKEDSNQGGDNV
ncbi:MAG: hypothetical protein ATN33_03365 [Epulopiscium sp. Nele67-Bin001]|nr:MAG: hypothetical protein ATN33_03365 [Epulopiscium sp. Nele67-Bin001]